MDDPELNYRGKAEALGAVALPKPIPLQQFMEAVAKYLPPLNTK